MADCLFCGKRIPAGATSCPHCRGPVSGVRAPVPSSPSSESLEQRVLGFVKQGNKIAAIKLYREETGTGLAEAKYAVEAIEAGKSLTPGSSLANDFPEGFEGELLKLLAAGKTIEAIKRYREKTGSGLKESKEAVEALAKEHGVVMQGVGKGCGSAVLAIVCVGTVAAVWWCG